MDGIKRTTDLVKVIFDGRYYIGIISGKIDPERRKFADYPIFNVSFELLVQGGRYLMKSLSSDLLAKINTPLQTISNNADPKMEIAVARAKSTVSDSTYWTVETIREIGGLGDVSVAPRRFKSYGRPNRIYEIHVRDGVVNTSIREYPDKLKEGFKTQFSLGPGTSVSIAFNGFWERNRKLWRLITDESPWIFWVDNNGILWRQLWDDISTKEQLDTQVLRVRAIRAWKNVNFADKDQGIIVGYIKMDGTVWYRNYCQQIDYSYIWENARQLTEFVGVGVNINLFYNQ